MKETKAITMITASAMLASMTAVAAIYGDVPDARHAWSVHDMNRPNPVKVSAEAGKPPSDAGVLFDGTKDSIEKNW